MLTFIIIILLIVGGVIIFFQTAPQIGGKPKGERLDRMQSASNFKDGVFVNTLETKMDMSFADVRKTLAHYLFADKTNKSPRKTIETRPFNSVAFNNAADTGIFMTWFGHSSILLKVDGVTILFDPVLKGERASMFSFMGPKRFSYTEYPAIEDLPEVDAVIISHDHYDHLDYPTIKLLKDKVDRFYMPLGVGAHFESWGVPKENITELEWWQEAKFGELTLALTPTRHFSGRSFGDRFHTLWGSWVILGKKERVYFSGDSGYFSGFKEIGERYGPFDLTFMECGAYNESWSEIHMFPEQTAQAHLDLKGELLMPIHWGKFDLALHPWKESVQRLHKKAAEENIKLFTPEIGQLISIQNGIETERWWEGYE
ncbi:L-ascorbate metabolism protein UlaG, beta-lactamase superfamily [Ekhidna lutea]|uniref:L-ascorbate metabolism protein UlaG, beta-lactamase superfamily n=2 Tax=Ekhidna lutea TaxID=447679 RepID=A0A239J2Z3_EKHLU|nr:L-ascorbate metabolism protein UlaG, beta-lactamase superfamily [Ekhidna lutea]